MKVRTLSMAAGVVAALMSTAALACGESLYWVGKGVAYRQYTAPLPGNILAVASTEAELMMIERLVAAGHDVHVVASPDELRSELDETDHEFDIVLAYFSQRDDVLRNTSGYSATYLPVALRDSGEEAQASAEYRRSLSSDDSVKRFLKTIHKTLKDRRRA